MDPLVIERDTSNVQTTKNNLHGERVLNDDKRTQTYAVNHLDNLNQAQKETLTHEIQQATRVSDVNNVYSKARALDSEMQKLKDIVGQQDSVRKLAIMLMKIVQRNKRITMLLHRAKQSLIKRHNLLCQMTKSKIRLIK